MVSAKTKSSEGNTNKQVLSRVSHLPTERQNLDCFALNKKDRDMLLEQVPCLLV